MKYLKLEVTREQSTYLYVEVPDDFDEKTMWHSIHAARLGEIAEYTTDRGDWDDFGWEETISVQSVVVVTADEASKYPTGKLAEHQ